MSVNERRTGRSKAWVLRVDVVTHRILSVELIFTDAACFQHLFSIGAGYLVILFGVDFVIDIYNNILKLEFITCLTYTILPSLTLLKPQELSRPRVEYKKGSNQVEILTSLELFPLLIIQLHSYRNSRYDSLLLPLHLRGNDSKALSAYPCQAHASSCP